MWWVRELSRIADVADVAVLSDEDADTVWVALETLVEKLTGEPYPLPETVEVPLHKYGLDLADMPDPLTGLTDGR